MAARSGGEEPSGVRSDGSTSWIVARRSSAPNIGRGHRCEATERRIELLVAPGHGRSPAIPTTSSAPSRSTVRARKRLRTGFLGPRPKGGLSGHGATEARRSTHRRPHGHPRPASRNNRWCATVFGHVPRERAGPPLYMRAPGGVDPAVRNPRGPPTLGPGSDDGERLAKRLLAGFDRFGAIPPSADPPCPSAERYRAVRPHDCA